MTAETNIKAEITAVPFNKLIEAPDNVRKTRSQSGIAELAASIKSEGLLQNLVVRKVKGGKFEVVAGERRRRALAHLVEVGDLAKTASISCQVIAGDVTSLSLAENIHREAMNVADQFEAWAAMVDSGMTIEDIAARHGATKRLIEQRLKLGRLSPKLLEALRDGKLTIDTASAFTVNEDHERQERVFERLSQYYNLSASQVRRAMTEGETPSTDPLARLIGREEYERAGGSVREDLFGDDVYFQDAELLHQLATTKLETEAERIKAELGLAWAEITDDYEYEALRGMRRIQPASVELSADDEAEQDRIRARMEELEDASDEWGDAEEDEWNELEQSLNEIALRSEAYDPEECKVAGCFLHVDYLGEIKVYGPAIRPEDDPVAKACRKALADKKAAGGGLAQSLQDDLAAIRLEILRAELLKNPIIARDLLAFHTIRSVLSKSFARTPFQMRTNECSERRTKAEKGDMGVFHGRDAVEAIIADLPLDWHEIEDIAESFDAFRGLSDDEKTRLQAYAASLMLQPQLATDQSPEPTLERAAELMGTDAATYWTPGVEFFERTTKAYMLETAKAVMGAAFAENHQKSKKADLAFTLGVRVFRQSLEDKPHVSEEEAKRALAWVPEGMNPKTDTSEAA